MSFSKILFFLIILFDQLVKIIIKKNIPYAAEIHILPFLSITYIENTGIALGLFQGMNNLFIIISFIVILIFYLSRKNILEKGKIGGLTLSLIFAGAVSNLIDRIFRGKVIDFINLKFWSIFNIADASITIGAVLLVVCFLKK